MTPGEELHAAATKLRETAKGATPGRWWAGDPIGREFGGMDFPIASDHLLSSPPYVAYVDVSPEAMGVRSQVEDAKADATWIALVHPGLAEPLALLLEDQASMYEDFLPHGADMAERVVWHGLGIARTINGTTS